MSTQISHFNLVSILAGAVHCLAVTDEGEVYCWGQNNQAQLGDNVTSSKSEPTVLTALEGKHISGVSCGPGQVSHFSKKLNTEIIKSIIY